MMKLSNLANWRLRTEWSSHFCWLCFTVQLSTSLNTEWTPEGCCFASCSSGDGMASPRHWREWWAETPLTHRNIFLSLGLLICKINGLRMARSLHLRSSFAASSSSVHCQENHQHGGEEGRRAGRGGWSEAERRRKKSTSPRITLYLPPSPFELCSSSVVLRFITNLNLGCNCLCLWISYLYLHCVGPHAGRYIWKCNIKNM